MNFPGAPFATASRNLVKLRNSPVTWIWAVSLVLMHVLLDSLGGVTREPGVSIVEHFGLNREGILSGHLWEVFTYGFIHGSWAHLFFNVMLILMLGSLIEDIVGGLILSQAIGCGMIFGGVIHALMVPEGLLVGASGGCVSIFILYATLSPQSRVLPFFVSLGFLGAGFLLSSFLIALMNPELRIPVFSKWGASLDGVGLREIYGVGHACHFGGGLAGWATGRWILRPRWTLKRLRADQLRREARGLKP